MQRTAWEKIRVYLIIWLLILLVVVAAALITHWDAIAAVMASDLSSMISSLFTVGIMVYALIWMIRGR